MRKRVLIPEQDIPAAREELQRMMKETKHTHMYQRYQVILMMLEGESYEKIASYTGLSLATIFNYRKAYCEKGMKGLERKYAPGRPKFLTPEQEQQVYQTVVESTPVDVGFPVEMNWTAPLIRQWIEQTFQVKYSDRGTRDLLHRLNLSYTKPTYTLEKADVAKQEAFKESFETVKKTPQWTNRPNSI
jgi:putative transposase